VKEIATIFKLMGDVMTMEEVKKIMKAADIDGGGELDFPEMVGMLVKRAKSIQADEEITEAFIAIVGSMEGALTPDHLAKILPHLPIQEFRIPEAVEDEVRKMFQYAGTVNEEGGEMEHMFLEQFKKMMIGISELEVKQMPQTALVEDVNYKNPMAEEKNGEEENSGESDDDDAP
jgi:Ca2+-binding EF-hand superfamily protein